MVIFVEEVAFGWLVLLPVLWRLSVLLFAPLLGPALLGSLLPEVVDDLRLARGYSSPSAAISGLFSVSNWFVAFETRPLSESCSMPFMSKKEFLSSCNDTSVSRKFAPSIVSFAPAQTRKPALEFCKMANTFHI